jgi:hypothetical protein
MVNAARADVAAPIPPRIRYIRSRIAGNEYLPNATVTTILAATQQSKVLMTLPQVLQTSTDNLGRSLIMLGFMVWVASINPSRFRYGSASRSSRPEACTAFGATQLRRAQVIAANATASTLQKSFSPP